MYLLILQVSLFWIEICILFHVQLYTGKKFYWIKSIFFQKHVYHGFKSICYRIINIFIGSCSVFLWIHSIHAFDSIAFFSQCRLASVGFLREPMNIYNRKPLSLKFSWVSINFFDLYPISINFTNFSILNRKNVIESKAFLSKSMYIMDSNQYAIESVTYLLVLVVYFYEFIVYMLLERDAFDSIAFFSQCRLASVGFLREPMNIYNRKPLTLKFSWVSLWLHETFKLLENRLSSKKRAVIKILKLIVTRSVNYVYIIGSEFMVLVPGVFGLCSPFIRGVKNIFFVFSDSGFKWRFGRQKHINFDTNSF